MYPVQYLHNNTTSRVPDLGPTAKLVGTMAQDSVQKGKKKKPNPHVIEN